MKNGTATNSTSSKKPLCFVVGPIGKDNSAERKHADLMLHALIKHVLEHDDFGYKVKRADEDADPGMIGDRVVADIIRAELVVADLTDLNPNAFYELGIRHSTELPTIHVARSGTALPFDNIAHRTIFVDMSDWHSIEQARARLAESTRAISAQGYKVSNPITQANASFKMRQSEDPRDQVIAQMQERMLGLESTLTKFEINGIGRSNPDRAPPSPSDAIRPISHAYKAGDRSGATVRLAVTLGLNIEDAEKIIDFMINGKKIEAIKHLRSSTGMDFKDAKYVFEQIIN